MRDRPLGRGEGGDPPRIRAGCPRAIDACAYVQGELSPAEQEAFEAHAAACPICRDEVAWARHAIAELRSPVPAEAPVPEIEAAPFPAADLVPRVLAAIEAEDPSAWRRPRLGRAAICAAAIVLVCAGAFFAWRAADHRRAQEARTAAAALERAVRWLLSAQEESGAFRASPWGGDERFDVGLTGLAVLALLANLPDGASPFPETGVPLAVIPSAIDRAAGFLLAEQAADGRFGPAFAGALYNHAIATVALLEAEGVRLDPRLREPIDRALQYIVRTQAPDGGWGYLGPAGTDPNTSASSWPLHALVIGRALGRRGLEGPIERGFGRLARILDERGRPGYRRPGEYPYGPYGLTSMGASCVALLEDPAGFPAEARARLFEAVAREGGLAPGRDLYRDYFFALACRRLPRSVSEPWIAASVRAVLAAQVRTGGNRGSWEPEDRWVSVGGRVCSTALAVLILRADRRAERLSGWLARDGEGIRGGSGRGPAPRGREG